MVKIFVGNLSGDVTSRDLRDLFDEFGQIDDCEKLDHKQFGFVHMAKEDSAKTAVRNLHRKMFKGTKIVVELSASKPQKLYVGNLPRGTTSDDLKELFESAGAKVAQAENCDGKKFGFVRIDTTKGFKEVYQLIRQLNGSDFHGNSIVVELSEDKSLEEKKRLRAEQEHGIGPAPPHKRPAYQPYPTHDGNMGWGMQDQFNDFSSENWAQRGPANIMRGSGRGGRRFGGHFTGPDSRERFVGPGHVDGYGGFDGVNTGVPNCFQPRAPDLTDKVLVSNYKSKMFTLTGAANLQLLETGQFANCQVHCEGTTFQIHKSILSGKSLVFKKIMASSPSSLVVRDVDSQTMLMLLRFIYTGTVDVEEINPPRIVKLLTAADNYQVEMIREGLESALVENLDVENAVNYLIISEEFQLIDLKKVVTKFICSQAKFMKDKSEFKMKLSRYPHLLLELFEAASN